MSRLTYNEGFDVADIMAQGRWARNSVTTLKSKRGQRFLRDMEAALMSMAPKRLLYSTFLDPSTGETCALGTYARYMGCPDEQLYRLELDGGDEQAAWVAGKYGQAETLTWNVIDLNDGGYYGDKDETPEHRYNRVLEWVRANIVVLS